MTTVAEASLLFRAQRDPSVAGATTQVRRDVAEVAEETRRMGTASGQAAGGIRQMGTAMQRASVGARTYQANLKEAERSNRRFNNSVQNAGFQVADFFVQIESGTPIMRAAVQQGSQVLAVFGAYGAVLGAAAAIAGTFASDLFTTTDAIEAAEDASAKLTETQKGLTEIQKLVALDLDELRRLYGANSDEVDRLRISLASLQVEDTRRAIAGLGVDLEALFGRFAAAPPDEALGAVTPRVIAGFRNSIRALRDELGVTEAQALELGQAFLDLRNAEAFAQQAEELERVLDLMDDFGVDIARLPPEAQEIVRAFSELRIEQLGAEELARQLEEAISNGADATGRFVNQASDLADQLSRAVNEAASLRDAGLGNLEAARIRAQFVGDPVAEARALAAARFDAEVGSPADRAALPDGARGQVLADRATAIETAGEVARLNEQRRRALADLRRSQRSSRGGGRNSASEAERAARRQADVLADLRAEAAAIERRTAAEIAGGDAIRQNLVLENQIQALRRAGLNLADLEGGQNQARAQQIAEQSSALTDLQRAQEAAAAVTQAYASEVGASYASVTADIEAWRDETLDDLAAAGTAHQDLADDVEAVFNARLKAAYDDDLNRRRDWAAGVERGLRRIEGSTRSLGDVAENAIAGGFETASRAVEDFVVDGKVDIEDFVSFAIRQFFRLAQATAVDLAGGGSGGILGQVFSSLTGVSFGTGFSVSGTASIPTPATFTPGGAFPSVGGFFLHDGGMKANARIRPVPAALFDGAPRFHEGLKPNEFPAILEDTERVLTAAQQQATADTLMAQAQIIQGMLSATGTAESGTIPVTVNIHGVRGDARAEATQGDQGLMIDVLLDQIEGRIGQNIARGTGIAPAISQSFELKRRGTF
ncbi:MAG: phage tail tape measure C-terminal domain-containing protein [Pseudomonadota bacterium]